MNVTFRAWNYLWFFFSFLSKDNNFVICLTSVCKVDDNVTSIWYWKKSIAVAKKWQNLPNIFFSLSLQTSSSLVIISIAQYSLSCGYFKVHTFWEGHKMLENIHRRFVLCSASQIYVGDFAKFCGLLRIYELYPKLSIKLKTAEPNQFWATFEGRRF